MDIRNLRKETVCQIFTNSDYKTNKILLYSKELEYSDFI
jgi:hypothetical protein